MLKPSTLQRGFTREMIVQGPFLPASTAEQEPSQVSPGGGLVFGPERSRTFCLPSTEPHTFSFSVVRERTVKISKGTGEYPWGFRIQFSKPIVVTEVDTSE